MNATKETQYTSWIIVYIYIYIYIILCLLDKHDKCNVSKLAVTIKIQYLCVLKVHKIKTGKKTTKKTNKNKRTKNALSSSQRGTNIQYKSILFQNSTNKNATK